MRIKVLLTVIIVFVVIAAGGLGMGWYFQASQSKKIVEQAIAQINQTQSYLTYESIQTSGFPTEVRVSIVKPKFSGRIDELLKAIDKNLSPEGANLPSWQEDLALDGALTLSVNALSDEYKMTISGGWTSTATIGGQALSITSKSTVDNICRLKLERKGNVFSQLWNFQSLARNSETFSQDFRTLDCVFPAYTATDTASGVPVLSSGGGRFYVSRQPKGDTSDFRLVLQAIDAEILPEGDKHIMARMLALNPRYPYPAHFSIYGKQNIDIDLAYSGPTEFEKPGAKDQPIDVNLSKFSIANNLYASSLTLRLTGGKTGAERNAHWILRSESLVQPAYAQVMREMLSGFIAELYTGNGSEYNALRPMLPKRSPEEIYDIIVPLIPDYAGLGKMVLANDFNYTGTDDFASGNFNLTDFEISAAPYSVTAKGTMSKAPGQMVPVANVVIDCKNCPQLISDVFNYAMRVEKAITLLQPSEKPAPKTVTPELAAGMHMFLRELSEPAGDKTTLTDFHYTLISDGASNMTISGKSLDQVMALYGQYVVPVLPPPSPPSPSLQ